MKTTWLRLDGKDTEGFALRNRDTQTDFVLDSLPNGGNDVMHVLLYVLRVSKKKPAQILSLTDDGVLEFPGGNVSFITTPSFAAAVFMVRDQNGAIVDLVIAHRVRSETGLRDLLIRLRVLATKVPQAESLVRRMIDAPVVPAPKN